MQSVIYWQTPTIGCPPKYSLNTNFFRKFQSRSEKQRPQVCYVASQTKQIKQSLIFEDIIKPVENEMIELESNLTSVVGNKHPMLMAAAQQIFKGGGKKIRPALIILIAHATAKLQHDYQQGSPLIPQQYQLAKITEMIYTASQVHDDVMDEQDARVVKRLKKPAFGTRLAILAGDYLFAQSSWQLANLDNLEVINMISQVIADYAHGEISQEAALFDTNVDIPQYLSRCFYKTGSLIAAACRGAAALNDMNEQVKAAMYDYGKHLGLAIQIVDDIEDFELSSQQPDQPIGRDLVTGHLTAPVVYAIQKSTHLPSLIQRQFSNEDDFQESIDIVRQQGGVEYSTQLAISEASIAKQALNSLPECDEKKALYQMVDFVLQSLQQ
eukprot:TRINITY_DN4947_c0_g2_i1.p1 TRINITY_DN4947_c0_g2~~TRINITY_DN4947_c0_g2_i1.p1  ORF type:complete len:383 (+),score=50.73 TRINITY_DN4947_c0_g2_i1:69-1217(+)